MNRQRIHDIEGVASIAITACQMGESDAKVESDTRSVMVVMDMDRRDDALLVAEAIRQFPQPKHQTTDERERRRPIEEMLRVLSPEDELGALLRARKIVLRIADAL